MDSWLHPPPNHKGIHQSPPIHHDWEIGTGDPIAAAAQGYVAGAAAAKAHHYYQQMLGIGTVDMGMGPAAAAAAFPSHTGSGTGVSVGAAVGARALAEQESERSRELQLTRRVINWEELGFVVKPREEERSSRLQVVSPEL